MVDLSRERERQKLEKKAAMGDFAAQEKLWQMMQEDMQHPPVEVDPAILEEQRNAKTKNNDGLLDSFKDAVLDFIKEDPIKATEVMEEPIKAVDVLPDVLPKAIDPVVKQGWEESTQPIWERDSTKKIIGEDGADKLQDTLNPARWAENAIDDSGVIPDEMKGTVKTILPVALIGGAALLLITALK